MENNNSLDFFSRINIEDKDLNNILNQIVIQYNFGNYVSYKLVEMGFEDFNIILDTTKGKFFVKVFNRERSNENIQRYIDTLKILNEYRDIFYNPEIYLNDKNEALSRIYLNETKYIDYCVMEYIEGITISELKTSLDIKTILQIAFDILVFSNKLPKLKKYIYSEEADKGIKYSEWLYDNLVQTYLDKKDCLLPDEEKLVLSTIDYFNDMKKRNTKASIDMRENKINSRKSSIFCDFIGSNIIINNNKLNYIDFSAVTKGLNFYDIAIFGCDICLLENINSKEYLDLLSIISYVLYRLKIDEYSWYPSAVCVQHALHLLNGAHLKRVDKVEDSNVEYYINKGYNGLKYISDQKALNKEILKSDEDFENVTKLIKELDLHDYIEQKIYEFQELN